MTDHYDVIVIGSGAGGGTLTHALAPTGKRILLLERGDFLPREPQNWDSKSVWVDLRYRNPGKWTDAGTGMEFTPKQHYYVGGNTKFYGAILFRFRERDFGPIQHVDGISPAWPVDYADFAPWYTRAEHLYHVHGQHGADPDDPPTASTYRYPPLSHEPRIAQLETDLTKAGLHPFPLPVGLIYDESAPPFSPCIRCATCDGYPCLVNGKADAHVVCVEPALRYPNVTLRTRTRVVRLDTDRGGRTVTRVVAERDGRPEEYSADLVVLSAGAINSAALLLASASDRHPAGFLIPVFFVASGIRLNLTGLLHSPSALARVPVFLLALLIVRGLPAFTGLRVNGTKPTLALGLLQATSLPFIVTATQIGVALGKISSVTAAALVCAGLLSVLIFPLIALVLLRQGEPAPAPDVDTAAAAMQPEPEPHLM